MSAALRLIHDSEADERAEIDALRTRHRVAAIVVGAEGADSWRPEDPDLAAIVDAVATVAAGTGERLVDVGLVFDSLRERDPRKPWIEIVRVLLAGWDQREEHARHWRS